MRHHYYEPIVFPADLKRDLDLPRQIAGLNLNEAAQLALIAQFNYRDELLAIPVHQKAWANLATTTAPSSLEMPNFFII